VIAAREKEIKTAVNKEVKAQDTKHLIAMVAEKEVAQKRTKYIATTPKPSSIQDRPDKKDRPVQYRTERKYRPSIEDRSKQDVSGTQWVYRFAPEIVMTKEKGFLKTVKSTVIIFPTKHNTLQEVRYAWGTVLSLLDLLLF